MNETTDSRHWADEIGADLAGREKPQVISTGISPSGVFHVGHLREVITADAVYRALRVISACLPRTSSGQRERM